MSRNRLQPPKIAALLLKQLRYYQEEHLIGNDLDGEFREQLLEKGRFRAKLWYWSQVLYALCADLKLSFWFGGVMLKNLFKVTLRNIRRQKLHAFINIAGLAVGLTVCILMVQYIRFEISFDNFHQHAERIYRINAHDLGRDLKFARTQAMLARTLKKDFPEILYAARLKNWSGYFKYQEHVFDETRFCCVDPDFDDIFSYPIIAGDYAALDEPFSLFLTEKLAQKYFRNEDALGKTLSFDNQYEFVVRGILQDVPDNSYLQFDILVSMPSLEIIWGKSWLNRWISHDFSTFVLLAKNTDLDRFEEKLHDFIRPQDIGHDDARDVFFSQTLKRIHLGSGLRSEEGETNDIRYVYVLSFSAALILLIACLNYMTLATARAMKRTREIGLRKVVGARRISLVKQFLGESVLFSGAAFILSVISVELLLPAFNQLMNRNLDLSIKADLPLFLGISLLVGIAAGLYPAFYLSSFQPTQIFRSALKKDSRSSSVLRKVLVVSQFVITIALISSILITRNQLNYLVKKSAKEFKDPVLTVNINDQELRKDHEALLQAFKQSPQVLATTASYSHPLRISWGMGVEWLGAEPDKKGGFMRLGPIDFNYIDFYGINVIRGRKLLADSSVDKNEALLINETAAKIAPWEDPIGKRMIINGLEGVVIGIVEDFHFQPLYNQVEPLALRHMFPEGVASGAGFISLKISSYDIPGTLKFLEESWQKFSSYFPFRYSFLDDVIDRTYRSEIRLGKSLSVFTVIAILLACLGLFGLTSFTAERRTKEIGIRKVLGASTPGIMVMLTKDIIKWVFLAVVIAFPLAYYAMHEWLQRFIYRIDISWGSFLLAALFSLAVALLAMSYQSIKAASADPVSSLRYE